MKIRKENNKELGPLLTILTFIFVNYQTSELQCNY